MHAFNHRTGEPIAAQAEHTNGDGTHRQDRAGMFIVPCVAVCFEDEGEMIPLKVFADERDAEKWVRRRQHQPPTKLGKARGHYKPRK